MTQAEELLEKVMKCVTTSCQTAPLKVDNAIKAIEQHDKQVIDAYKERLKVMFSQSNEYPKQGVINIIDISK